MKYLATVALMLNLGVAGVHAQSKPVKMTFSGSVAFIALPPSLNPFPGTVTDEENFAGTGSLGRFTFHGFRTDKTAEESSNTCSPGPFARVAAASGVFRFEDGSLLTVTLTEGSLCLDLVAGRGKFSHAYRITGGTGRFKNASGSLAWTYTLRVVMADASNQPFFFAGTGESTGMVLGVAREDDRE